MESSPNTERSETETLNPTLTNGQDSLDKLVASEEVRASDPPQSTEDTSTVGEKRKREDGEEGNDKKTPQSSDPTLNPLWKTSLCSYFRSISGSCSHGSTCRYAHGEEELRIRPDNTWDPTSERAKKAARTDNGGKCEEKKEDGDVLITEAVMDEIDDEDGDGNGNGGSGECVMDPVLGKCLVHIPRKWHSDDLRKFLREQGVEFKFAKKKKGMTVGFVRFDSTDQLQSATEVLQGKVVGNKNLKIADVIPRSIDKNIKSAMETDAATDGSKSISGVATDGSSSKMKTAREAVTPLAHLSYAEQLEQKKSSITQMLKKLTRNARKACPSGISLPEWVLNSREIGGLCCKLEGIIESPAINGYRNKCEFSVGYSVQGKQTVGFMLGNFREGVTAVEEPVDCLNVSRIACKYASIFQEFLQNSSFPVWNRFKNCGFWRQLTVREGRISGNVSDVEDIESKISEVMLMVQVSTSGHDEAQLAAEFDNMARAFAEGARTCSPPLPLTVLVIQDHQGISNVAPSDAPLRSLSIPVSENGSNLDPTSTALADNRIHDYISNLRFSISPTAFFQVNTLAAEKLYSLAGDWADLGPDTLLFDICCGTGTIGLTLAHRVGMVVGVEMNASAVMDAQRNAEINGITNCKFVCSKAEDVMGPLLKEYLDVAKEPSELPTVSDPSKKESSTEDKNMSEDNPPDAKGFLNSVAENGQPAAEGSVIGQETLQDKDEENPSRKQFKNVVAIVDPPRSGLHPTVIKALRTHPGLKRLVYISCNPETLVANAIELCTPSPDKVEKGKKDNRGWRNMSSAGLARHRTKSMPVSDPFRPVKAMAVDLFPHTPHCEMVMLLER